jgi:hypothetical protein
VAAIGEMLRAVRMQWGLSLRDVKMRSLSLADAWGNRAYEISGSWLCKMEHGSFEITVPKLIALATIYSCSPEELLQHCLPLPASLVAGDRRVLCQPCTPGERSLEREARQLFRCNCAPDRVPAATTLLALEEDGAHLRRAVVGENDRALSPMIRPGAVLKIDTQKRAIATRREWSTEYDRPIYLLQTHRGLASGWCELDKAGSWLSLIPHPLSPEPNQRWRYRKEVEVIGRAVAAAIHLGPLC